MDCILCNKPADKVEEWEDRGTVVTDFRCENNHLTQALSDEPFMQTFVLDEDGMELYTLDHIDGRVVAIRDWDVWNGTAYGVRLTNLEGEPQLTPTVVYTRQHVMEQQYADADGVDEDAWEDDLRDSYVLVRIAASSLCRANHVPLDIDYMTWLEYRSDVIVNGVPHLDIHGLETIARLMNRLHNEEPVNPIVLSCDRILVDGLHRLVARMSMGKTHVDAYVPTKRRK